jgi:hypothetical protein
MEERESKFGPPDIHLAGLQIWVHSRQFPEASDYEDGNWINVTVHCGAKDADVWVSGPIIHLPEIGSWADACTKMYERLSGEANLDCIEPELSVRLRAETPGHISMEVAITPDQLTQQHRLQFEVDQSYLAEMIDGSRRLLAKYPIKK